MKSQGPPQREPECPRAIEGSTRCAQSECRLFPTANTLSHNLPQLHHAHRYAISLSIHSTLFRDDCLLIITHSSLKCISIIPFGINRQKQSEAGLHIIWHIVCEWLIAGRSSRQRMTFEMFHPASPSRGSRRITLRQKQRNGEGRKCDKKGGITITNKRKEKRHSCVVRYYCAMSSNFHKIKRKLCILKICNVSLQYWIGMQERVPNSGCRVAVSRGRPGDADGVLCGPRHGGSGGMENG
jgi:hypothetical protein